MPHERSNYGCWTCRVRKKKCDEQLPICSTCHSRSITCHGYGPKPQWLDGAEKERKEAESLKRAVRDNLKQKKSLGSATFQTLNGCVKYGISSSPSSGSTYGARPSYCPPETTAVKTLPLALGPCPDSIEQAPIPTLEHPLSGPSFKDFEATLLMNYLDHVFPIQFDCYTPPVVELGRGWLLALLTRTKSLYHAALALSCLYMHSVLLKTRQQPSRCVQRHWDQMNRYYALSFQEIQDEISVSSSSEGERSLKENIEILACIVQLILFELLLWSWPIHLAAASSIVPSLMAVRKTRPGTATHTERLDRGNRYEIANEIACDFLVGVSVWFDILGSASTRSKPFLEKNVQYLGNIELDKVMGCESSVMVLMAKISRLEEWKRDMQSTGKLSIIELSSRGSEIEQLLKHELAKQTADACGPALATSTSRHIPTITKIFTHANLTYLHTVVSGAHPELPEIKASVSVTIAKLSNLPDPKLLQNLIWPCGCMASKDQDSLFRGLLTELDINEHCPGNYWKAFEVIQECWRLRENQSVASDGADWTRAMSSLGFQVLLV